MATDRQHYDYIEIKMRPKKDGLHESGYRYIRIVGVWTDDDAQTHREDLHQWADHVRFQERMGVSSGVNVEFTEDGVLRMWSRWGFVCTDGKFFYSTATFQPAGGTP